jgi:hypothetical protein
MPALNLQTAEPPHPYRRLVWLIYAAAIALRIWRYICGDFSGENAIMGQMASDWLYGEVPLFFYGQSHMGGWDTLLSAPLIAIFGPSAWIINLWPPLISMGVMVICHRLFKLMLPPAGVLAGLIYLAVPPTYWLFYSGYAQTHNTICILLEALLMLLTIRFWKHKDPGVWLYAVLGLIAGAGFYLNFQMGVGIIACASFILVFCWRKLKPLKVAATVAGAIVGLMPLILFELQRGGEHVGVLNSFSWRFALEHWRPLITNALPIILGFHGPSVQCKVGATSLMWGPYLILCGMFLFGMVLLIKQGLAKERRHTLLPVMLGLTSIAVVLFSEYGRVLGGFHQTYLFSMYLMLPFAWGAFAGRLTRRTLAVSLTLSCLLAGLNFYNYDNFCVHNLRLLSRPFYLENKERAYLDRMALVKKAGVEAMYTRSADPYIFYGRRHTITANHYNERNARKSFQVDMHLDPMFYADGKILNSSELLGLEYQTTQLGRRKGFWHFKLPSGADRVLDLPLATARTLKGDDLGGVITDRNASTMYTSHTGARPGQGFVLDLGREMRVAGFSLVPNHYNDSPGGLKVEAAGEDGEFKLIREVKGYWGPFYLSGPHPVLKARHPRTDCYFPTRNLRYLRLTNLSKSRFCFTVRDILLFGPDKQAAKNPGWKNSISRALELIDQKGYETVYADTWAAAWIKYHLPDVFTIAGNVNQDNYGYALPRLDDHWMLKPGPKSALLVEPKYSAAILQSLRRSWIPAQKTALGSLDLIELAGQRSGGEVEIKGISSNVDKEAARDLLKPGGDRWASQKNQSPEAYLRLDLGSPKPVLGLELQSPGYPKDYPRTLLVEASRDGLNWRKVKAEPVLPLSFSGQVLLVEPGKINLFRLEKGLKARYLRLRVKGDGSPYWWSVEKVRLFEP